MKVFECKISNGDQATIHYVVEYKFKFHNCLSLTYVSISLTITDIRINKSYMYLIVYFQSFNDGVMQYNTYKQSFPQNFFAGPFGHAADASLLEFEDSAEIQAVPKVEF